MQDTESLLIEEMRILRESYLALEAENERLRKQNEQLQNLAECTAMELQLAQVKLNRAKNPEPVERPSMKRVYDLIKDAGLKIAKLSKGYRVSWFSSFAGHCRYFKTLKEAFDLFSDSWNLTELLCDRFEALPAWLLPKEDRPKREKPQPINPFSGPNAEAEFKRYREELKRWHGPKHASTLVTAYG